MNEIKKTVIGNRDQLIKEKEELQMIKESIEIIAALEYPDFLKFCKEKANEQYLYKAFWSIAKKIQKNINKE